jgi:hypothetical protein
MSRFADDNTLSLFGGFMRKLFAMIAPLALGAAVCGLLSADDSAPPPSAGSTDAWQERCESVWWTEHTAAIANTAETSGVQAVVQARELLKNQNPQVSLDFFNKALFDVKNRAVQRQIRMELFDLYKQQGQSDKAMDQLQQLMMDQ